MEDNPGLAFLKRFFGYAGWRPFQEEIVKAICRGRDVFAVMPTGGGKSLCYQFPAVVLDGVCVVISPLLSLMKDQVDSAREIGIRAATLNSTTGKRDFARAAEAMDRNKLDLLYISPERFNNPAFMERLTKTTRFHMWFVCVTCRGASERKSGGGTYENPRIRQRNLFFCH